MLKLATLAPSLLKLLAEDKLDMEQCQALCLESDQDRQVAVYENLMATYSCASAHLLKRQITESEIAVTDARFEAIGREAYELAGGVSEKIYSAHRRATWTVDRLLVDTLMAENWRKLPSKSSRKRAGMGDGPSRISRYGAK
ncbi:hypothetical protein QM104_23825 [Leclercia adecarboxylata]|nr:hypothetical protein [Leclercia adecarboxylata]MDV5280045.1 hypothetical protein [Leclercia adecarboxylata]